MNIPITEEDGAGEANPEGPKSAEGEDKPDLATMPAGGDNPQGFSARTDSYLILWKYLVLTYTSQTSCEKNGRV